jgi:hypothetical protein
MATSPVQGQTLIVQMMLDAKARQSADAGSSKSMRAQMWSEAAAKKQSTAAITNVHSVPNRRAEASSIRRPSPRAKPSSIRDPRVIDNTHFTKRSPATTDRSAACTGGRAIPASCPAPRLKPPEPPLSPQVSTPPPVPPEVGGPAGPEMPPPDSGQTVIDHAIVLDGAMDQTVANLANDGEDFGVVVGNGQHSENIILDNITATNCTDYGMYLGDVANWSINNSTFHQAAGANQHGMRIGYGQNISITNTTVDSSLAGKSSLWLVDVEGITIADSTFNGGAIRFGATPESGQGEPSARDITITNSTINKVSGGDMEAMVAWPGSHNIHLSDLDITLETSQHWLAIDSRNTSNITWSNIRVNGQLINGFEGVGINEPIEDLLMRGIGPVAQCV